MQNKVTVTIDGQEYTLVASEDAAYMKKIAAHVDSKIAEVRQDSRIPVLDGVVLAALNMADEYFKSLETAENLRTQIKDCLEESKKLEMELSDMKRELFKAQNQRK